ncbi:CHAT domain-containing protein [Spirosoma foliorum]|uniref:Tetratricopeptide repeat protein n=1 Tax=Spirosoma foliorum TaxID=2710596 RepID=A0A7G5GRL6_9BACT|nr:CHAT domain-containing protein [Spirosoma foliorum]QMW01508.1 tetratricopeptide repeat protein [Spirosoma foliorum]
MNIIGQFLKSDFFLKVSPTGWAFAQNIFGSIYAQSQKGDQASNIELAIEAYQQALKVYNQKDKPQLWAMVQHNLGNAYRARIKEDRATNIELAIEAYQQAFKVYTYKDLPLDWAMTQNGLGNAYTERIKEERASNIELAIEAYQQALKVYNQKDKPQLWAMVQHNLGNAYRARIKEDRATNIELAIEAYQQAFKVYTYKDLPLDWAMTQNNLGSAYSERIKGSKAINIELAIEAYQQALKVYIQSDFPLDWAGVQNNLGNAYRIRIREDRVQNIELSIEAHQYALKIFKQSDFPLEWANTQNNLGTAYRARISGDLAQNIELAIEAFQQALQIRNKKDLPLAWAMSKLNLGNAFSDRINGHQADNIELAIEAYSLALEVFTFYSLPQEWAVTQNSLGNAYRNRVLGDQEKNIELAIDAFQKALKVYTEQDQPLDWATAQNNLGNAYSARIFGDRIQNLQLAIKSFALALQVRTEQALPVEWATTQHNIGIAYLDNINGDQLLNVDLAINSFQRALRIFNPHLFPLQSFRTATILGMLFFKREDWGQARKVFEQAHQAAEYSRQQQYLPNRKRLADETADLYSYLISVCLQLNDKIAAFQYILAAKGRSDIERLGLLQTVEQLLDKYPEMADDYTSIRQLQQILNELSFKLEILSKPSNDDLLLDEDEKKQQWIKLTEQILQYRLQLQKAFERLNFRFPRSTSVQPLPSLTAQKMQELANEMGATLIEYFRHWNGWIAFIVSADRSVNCVEFPADLDTFLQKHLLSNDNYNILNSFQEDHPMHERLYFKSFYQRLIAPLEDFLPEKGQLFIAPEGILYQVPFGALWKKNITHRLMDQFLLSLVPSLSFLFNLFQQRKSISIDPLARQDRLLSVVYPGNDPSDRNYLTHAYKEAIEVAKHFMHTEQLDNEQAQPDQLIKLCQQKAFSVIHFGCHGRFEKEAPEYSCLILHRSLTVQQIVNELRLQQSPLATLGACQTGLSRTFKGGDQTGLSQALFMAGAKTVLASLWSVNDESTRVLFEHFYRKRAEFGVSEAEALQYAQQQVRQYPEWQDAYYWAAFQIMGQTN